MTNVSTSAFYESAIFNMTKLRESTNKLQQQLSTSSKLTHSYDDPLAAAQMRAMQAADTLSTADTATTTAAKSLLSQTDDTLSQFATVVSQLQTLATQAANGTLNTTDRAALGTQIAAYYQNLTSLANTTNADGHALFGGQGTGSAYVTDASGNMIYNGTGTASTLSLGPGFSVTTSVTGPDFLNFTGADGTAKNLFSVVKNLATAMKDLNIGLDSISTSQTVVGARLAWIDTTSSMQTQINTLRSTNEASTGGTDYAATAALLSQQMTVLSASQASFMKVASLSLMTYLN
jgi:flagellar hook-associated protein 3 FlgL